MIDIEFLDELQKFQLALTKHSDERSQGEQSSSFTGQGMIFKDHKQYAPGDDIRKIDWKAYARTKDYFVKRFEEEKNLTLHILLDRSSSMDYGEPKKYDYGGKIGIAIADMALNTNDRFRFSVFSETITDISSGRRNSNTPSIISTLNQLRKTPESRVERCLTEYSSRIKNKSAVIIISDFLTDLEDIESGIESLKNTEVILVNVFDKEEIDPSFEGDTILKDPESESTLRTYLSSRTKNKYQKQLKEHTEQIEEIANKHGARYLQVSTGDDVLESFLEVWQAINR
ncbi:DUF58 domain-containing protein [Candidatus Nanohalovita haloferacivicina]|uniref:DUF58 domain-containing protein n=1 Tax=Candidatus Nanohalovita haloferacivicina TaxID=2978046 RepID=UPI00325FDD07|nr:DUF58 family protein [Candidatus Nanohalobia archaeon BNXNv]